MPKIKKTLKMVPDASEQTAKRKASNQPESAVQARRSRRTTITTSRLAEFVATQASPLESDDPSNVQGSGGDRSKGSESHASASGSESGDESDMETSMPRDAPRPQSGRHDESDVSRDSSSEPDPMMKRTRTLVTDCHPRTPAPVAPHA